MRPLASFAQMWSVHIAYTKSVETALVGMPNSLSRYLHRDKDSKICLEFARLAI